MNSEYRDNSGSLYFSTDKIELNLDAGEVYRGFFDIEEHIGHNMEGYVYSSSIRVRLDVDSFHGGRASIPYEVDTEGMEPGDVLKGQFMIVSNVGEYVLPFVVMTNLNVLESSMGTIKNLFHFTNLARTDWDEAVRLFNHPSFKEIMTGNDARYRDLYMGLSARGNRNYNLEEFLIGINKKQKVEFSVSEESVRITEPQGAVSYSIDLERNGWGYTLLAVKASGDFIELGRTRLEEEDFVENVCHYEFIVHEDRLHKGNNYGSISFKSLYGTVTVDVLVTNSVLAGSSIGYRKRKNVQYTLISHYMDYVTGRLTKDKWIALSYELIHDRAIMDASELECVLYEIHMLIIEERFNEAKWLLDRRITSRIEDAPNELYCYYLYLMTLYSADDYYSREITERVKSIYEKDPDNWRVAWAYLKMSDDFKRNPTRMYAFALRQVERGCSSPVFLVEVIKLLNTLPSLLVHFDDDERRLLLFGARHRLLNDELIDHIAYHSSRQRGYDEMIVRTLVSLYDIRPTDDMVAAICTQLMKGDKVAQKYFKWYELAVQKNLNITRLYENYILSMDLNGRHDLPREVLMYFSYQSNLPVPQTAYIYAYVVKNRESMPDIYTLYRASIERFVVKQLYAGRIGRDLAYLYEELLMKEMATVDNLKQFATLLLTHGIEVEDSSIVSVVVIDERLKEEMVFPVSGGQAQVVLPSSDYTILFEDSLGNRFYQTKEYSTERYLLPRKFLSTIEEHVEDSLMFNLYVCEGNKDYINITEHNVNRFAYLESCGGVSDSFAAAIRLPLIRYYLDIDASDRVDALLESVGASDVASKDHDELIRLLMLRGFLDKAYEYTLYYGPENLDAKILLRLTDMILERDGLIEDCNLTYVAMSAFDRGKYDDSSLCYLIRYYEGPVKNLRDIWKSAIGFDVDTYSICERMIKQALSTGAYIGEEVEILKAYVSGGADTDIVLQFVTYLANEYFVRDEIVDEYVFRTIARIYENENELPDVCMLAFLKFYADEGEALIDADIQTHIRRYVHILSVEQGIIMPYMQKFKDISPEARALSDMTMIEYRGEPGARVIINYTYVRNDEDQSYAREEMSCVYEGVYIKAFTLFFGESVQYYITEELGESEQLTESGTINCNEADTDSGISRYTITNDIAVATTLKDYDTALELLEEFKYREYLVGSLFKLH